VPAVLHALCRRDDDRGKSFRAASDSQESRMRDRGCRPGQSPSRWRRLRTFALALLRHLLNRARQVPEAVYRARLAACETCEHNRSGACELCGCPLAGAVRAKARWASERCPLSPPKWGRFVWWGRSVRGG
jgi:hypothetical protein